MSENDDLHSGSRWEPQTGWRSAADPYDDPAASTAEAPPGGGRPAGRTRRGTLAGAGTAILLIGGIGGFAIGHAVAAPGGGSGNPAVVPNGIPGQDGVPGEGFGDGDGFHDHAGDGDRDRGGLDHVPPGGSGDGGTGGNA